jgi:hypothetical protein
MNWRYSNPITGADEKTKTTSSVTDSDKIDETEKTKSNFQSKEIELNCFVLVFSILIFNEPNR